MADEQSAPLAASPARCPNCGAPAQGKFCSECGAALTGESPNPYLLFVDSFFKVGELRRCEPLSLVPIPSAGSAAAPRPGIRWHPGR